MAVWLLGAAPAAAAGPEAITIEASDSRLTHGDELILTGEVSPRRAGRTVELQYKPPRGEYDTVNEKTTDDDGDYRFKVVPEHSGHFRAVAIDDSGGEDVESERVAVEVAATVSARAKQHTLRGTPVDVHGRLRPAGAGRTVVIQRRKRGDWERVASATTARDGAYSVRWEPPIGSYRIRARFRGDDLNGRATDAPNHRVNVYRSKRASWYGPGLYGNRTACGQTLKRGTLGVAHKTLPCGTKVRFYYRGRTVRVPVIDRGPFIAGREWDLTEATKDALRFPDLDDVWSTK